MIQIQGRMSLIYTSEPMEKDASETLTYDYGSDNYASKHTKSKGLKKGNTKCEVEVDIRLLETFIQFLSGKPKCQRRISTIYTPTEASEMIS